MSLARIGRPGALQPHLPFGEQAFVIIHHSGNRLGYSPATMAARTFVDLFAGAGGISEGLRQVGWLPIAGSDIDPDACATYRLNFPEATTLWGDLQDRSLHHELVEVARHVD